MKMCKHCKQYLEMFNSEFRPEIFWFKEKMKSLDYCKNQFLDKDSLLKSCLIFYNEKLTQNLDQPERSKREDLDCCKELIKLERLNEIIINENIDCGEWHTDYVDICIIFSNLIKQSKMRCSEHYGNIVRDK